MKLRQLIAAAATFAAATAGAQGSTANAFRWDGNMVSGSTLLVRNIHGAIVVERASGQSVEIVAEKRATRGDPATVRIEAKRYGPGDRNVIVCAMWTATDRCEESGSLQNREGRADSNGDVSVTFRIRMPAGVVAQVNTVNGDVNVRGSTAELRAATVNGDVELAPEGGPVNASTVNGNVDVTAGNIPGTSALSFTTVNGSIAVVLPAAFGAIVHATTVHGSISSDFPLSVQGEFMNRSINGSIGSGGHALTMTTVNGSIALKKR